MRIGARATTSRSGMIYLKDNPLLQGAAEDGTRQTPAARPLGRQPGAVVRLGAPEPDDRQARPRRDLRGRARSRRARRARARPISKAPTPRSTRTRARTRRACRSSSSSSPSPATSAATSRRRRRARSTRAASLATACRTRTAWRSTTLTSSSPASSGTARRRPGRWRPPGTRTSSSIPSRDGAVLPILNLNGYKIANPTILARISHEELEALFVGYGYTPYFVEGSDPTRMHQQMAATLERGDRRDPRRSAGGARRPGHQARPRWPMIVLRSPKGWTGPKKIKGHKVEGSWRSHQVPFSDVRDNPANLQLLEDWMQQLQARGAVRRRRHA